MDIGWLVMKRRAPLRIILLVTLGVGLNPDHLTAQVTDSLAYLELLHEDALPADVMASERLIDDGAGASDAARRAKDRSGTAVRSWQAVVASSGRLAVSSAWSPAPWLEIAGSMLRESAEPVRLDPGAQWFLGEHSSGYIRVGGQRIRLILGDFRFRSAAAFSTMGMRTSEPSRQHPWRPSIRMPDLRPYSGSSQQPAPRGVALSISGTGGWSVDVYTSARREDGTIEVDTGRGTVQDTSQRTSTVLRKSWHLNSASGITSRRRVRLIARGGSVRVVHGPLRVGTSWTRFSVPGGSRNAIEAMGRWQWSAYRSGAGTGFLAVRVGLTPTEGTLSSWTVETSMPVADLAWNFHHRHEQPEASLPWGPDAGMEPRDHARRSTIASVAMRPVTGVTMVWGIRHHDRTPSARGHPEDRAVAAWIHAAGRTWAMELRIRNERDPVTGHWNGGSRLSLRRESAVGPHVNIRVHAVAARAGGLGARVQWKASPKTRFVMGRTVTWGRDSEPWAVLATDRVPGLLGLLRMSAPTVHWSLRLERSRSGPGTMTVFMDQRSLRDPFTGTFDTRRRLVVALRY